jgi:Protein of unknown function (DUF3866)
VLELRRGRVVSVEAGDRVTKLSVKIEGDDRARDAIAYPALTGPVEEDDEVVVNVEAQELGLGSGGYDIVHVNLTRGLSGEGIEGAHVMKLNYTPIQHAVSPIEVGLEALHADVDLPVAVLALHGQLAPAAFAASRWTGRARIGYLQTAGGALPGQLSEVVADLIQRDMLAGHVTVAPCFGGDHEAITLEGALQAVGERLDWDAAFIGPGPGILGSASKLGHGGLAALHAAQSAQALGSDVSLAPRLSSGDPRERHRGLSHHTRAVLELLRNPVWVPLPSGISDQANAQLEEALCAGSHRGVKVYVDEFVEPYVRSNLPPETMGRSLAEDEDFFRAAFGAGVLLVERIGGEG